MQLGRTGFALCAAVLGLVSCFGGGDEVEGNEPVVTEDEAEEAQAGPASELIASDLEPSRILSGEVVVSSSEEVRRILADYDAEAVDEGILITFPDDVLFPFDSASVTDEGRGVITDMAEVIVFYEGAPVQVRGHTDSRGSRDYNQRLSEARARAVEAALIADHGVDAARLTAAGFGMDRPVAPNEQPDGSDDEAGRAANRRVEVVIETDDETLLPD